LSIWDYPSLIVNLQQFYCQSAAIFRTKSNEQNINTFHCRHYTEVFSPISLPTLLLGIEDVLAASTWETASGSCAYLAMTRRMSSIIYRTLKANLMEMQCISLQIGNVPRNHFCCLCLPGPLWPLKRIVTQFTLIERIFYHACYCANKLIPHSFDRKLGNIHISVHNH
jgi:hypothetical protein